MNQLNKWAEIQKMPSRYEEFFINNKVPLAKNKVYRYVNFETRKEYENAWERLIQIKDTRFISIGATVLLGVETSLLFALGAPVPIQIGGCALTITSACTWFLNNQLFKQAEERFESTSKLCQEEINQHNQKCAERLY